MLIINKTILFYPPLPLRDPPCFADKGLILVDFSSIEARRGKIK